MIISFPAEPAKNILHFLSFLNVNNVSLAQGKLIEVTKAYVGTQKALSTPIVPWYHNGEPNLFHVHIIDV